MCFNVGGLGWVSIWGLGKHVHFATYPNCHILHVHVEPNYFQQIYWILFIINGLFMTVLALTFNCAYVLEHMHSTLASIITTMWVAYICDLWKFIPKNNNRIETWPKSILKKMETMLYLFILTQLFESQTKVIISCHIFLLPPFIDTCQTSYIQ
jgi:hypothetical protein